MQIFILLNSGLEENRQWLLGELFSQYARKLCEGFTKSYAVFLAVRFFMALAGTASGVASFCLGMYNLEPRLFLDGFYFSALEVTNSKWRIWVGGLFWIPYACGYTTLAAVAYVTREWRLMHIVISCPLFLAVPCWL